MDSLPPRSPIKNSSRTESKGELSSPNVSALPASFFQTSLNFTNEDFARKRYQTDSFDINFANSANSNGFDAFPTFQSPNHAKNASINTDNGKRAQRIRASSLSIPNDLSPFGNSVFSSVWSPIKPSDVAPEHSSFEYTDRFAPAVEESDDINAFSRTIGYLGLDDPLNSTNGVFSNRRSNSDLNRPRSISASFPSVSDELQGDVGLFSSRTISSMAVMTESSAEAAAPASSSVKPHSPIVNNSWQELTERFQAVVSSAPSAPHVINEEKRSPVLSTPEKVYSPAIAAAPSPEMVSASENTTPSRSLWIGNIDTNQSMDHLNQIFSRFGQIESVRMLPEKECAFVNFVRLDDALKARDTMQGSRIGNCVIRIGFGKTEALQDAQGGNPTKSLWVGNISPSTKPADLESVFSKYGAVESARVLTHKNCGFVNFISLQDAIHARQELNGKDIGGVCVKIGFAKVPSKADSPITATQALANPSVLATLVPGVIERLSAWQKPSSATAAKSPHISPAKSFESIPESTMYYNIEYTPILPIPELCPPRKKHDQARLREFRKKLEGHSVSSREVDQIFDEIIEDADELCSDYIGNVVIQKVMEKSNDEQRLLLIKKVAPLMAPLGVHKNGTWAIQKIIDLAKRTDQMEAIVEALRPFAPALLLDQFGNYVIQCCLRLGSEQNQFIFDAIASKTLEIGQGRFGARATKACLESQYISKDQQRKVSLSIVQNCVQLSMNANGSILLTWLLDGSVLPGRYRVLVPIMIPHIPLLACHKLASVSLLKIVNQRNELDARDLIIAEIFKEKTLAHIISDQNSGITLITKILSTCCVSVEERNQLVATVRKVLGQTRLKIEGTLNYKRLMEELNSTSFSPAVGFEAPSYSSTSSSSLTAQSSAGKESRATNPSQSMVGAPGIYRNVVGSGSPSRDSNNKFAALPTPHQSPTYPPGPGDYQSYI